MTWTKTSGICDRCGNERKNLLPSFGKHICEDCKNTRPNLGKGNAGLTDSPQENMTFEDGIHLDRVPKSNGMWGNLFFSHYPGSKGIPGRSLCYLVYKEKELVGIIGVNSPPCNYKIFRNYFGCDNDNVFVNNNVFRLIKQEKNLGTKVLRKFRARVYQDYLRKYNERLLGIVTFVEKPRTGAMYKADNWKLLGETQGKRMKRDSITWQKVFADGEIKLIFGYKYGGV
jgi:hypothetical protein